MSVFKKIFAPLVFGWDGLTEAQRDIARVVIVVAVLGLVGGAGYGPGKRAWQRWQHRQALAQVEVFANKGDYRNMILALRRATQLAPSDRATWEETVRRLAQIGSPETLVAREQLLRLAPGDPEVRESVAADALRLGQIDTAQAALAGAEESGRDLGFHRLAAALALALGQRQELEEQLAAIVAVQPTDWEAQFNFAATRLDTTDEKKRADAQQQLLRLIYEPSVRVRAGVLLLTDAARRRDAARLPDLISILLSSFAPSQAGTMVPGDLAGWNALLDGIRTAAAKGSPADVAMVARWNFEMGQRAEVQRWIEALPPTLRDASAVADVRAELAAALRDWVGLEPLLRRGAWGAIPERALTLALATERERPTTGGMSSATAWSRALTACEGSETGLRALARLAHACGNAAGAQQALELILEHNPRAFWAYEVLRRSYVEQRDLPHLWLLYGRWLRLLPEERNLLVPWVLIGCVLDRATPEAMASLAKLYEANPDVPVLMVAQAASLWRQKRASDAATILYQLPADEQARPETAYWIALVQASLSHPNAARQAAELARKLPLSESEQQLLTESGLTDR